MRVCNFVQHKAVAWVGVIYQDGFGQLRVCNGVCDWPLTPEREEKVRVVQKENADFSIFLDALDKSCKRDAEMALIREMVRSELNID